jgi:F-type H+-transporting ATPase subunit epsilon
VTLYVELVVPEGQIWSGEAQRVIAKTLDGDLGVLGGHAPVLGLLAEGSVVRILPERENSGEVMAAVAGGFLSVADDHVSILAQQAELGERVDVAAARSALDAAQAEAGNSETAEVRYAQALLRASGEQQS